MKKILFVIANNLFRDEEYLQPKEVLTKGGMSVVTASSKSDVSTGMLGAKVKPEILLSNVKEEDYNAIVFIGGSGSSEYFNDSLAHSLAKKFLANNKIVAAICIAPSTLANAGLLKGKNATCYPSEAPNLREKGAMVTDKPVVRDGLIITATGPSAATEFGHTILESLK